MRPLLGMAVVAAALALSGPAAAAGADKVTPAQTQAAKSGATDFSAHRRQYRHNYRPRYSSYRSYPTYYARPVYYRPYPYAVPAPFVFGIGYGPLW
jgi:outer membrane lipoprotein-sorting protein